MATSKSANTYNRQNWEDAVSITLDKHSLERSNLRIMFRVLDDVRYVGLILVYRLERSMQIAGNFSTSIIMVLSPTQFSIF